MIQRVDERFFERDAHADALDLVEQPEARHFILQVVDQRGEERAVVFQAKHALAVDQVRE